MQFTARNRRSVSSVHNETPNSKVQSRTNSGSLISIWTLGVFLSILHTSETTNEKDKRKAETREAPRNLPCFFAPNCPSLNSGSILYIYVYWPPLSGHYPGHLDVQMHTTFPDMVTRNVAPAKAVWSGHRQRKQCVGSRAGLNT